MAFVWLDYLPSDFFASCFECFTELSVAGFARGSARTGPCFRCHKPLTVAFEDVKFIKLAAPSESLAPKSASSAQLSDAQKRCVYDLVP